jgi:hypothetical protein
MSEQDTKHTIRTFALVCVGLSSIFIMAMVVWLTFVISSPSWCHQALGADKVVESRSAEAITGCLDLFQQQLTALSWNSHIFAAIIALCLLVLMVIVVAGGRLSFKASKDGLEGNISEESQEIIKDNAESIIDEVDK